MNNPYQQPESSSPPEETPRRRPGWASLFGIGVLSLVASIVGLFVTCLGTAAGAAYFGWQTSDAIGAIVAISLIAALLSGIFAARLLYRLEVADAEIKDRSKSGFEVKTSNSARSRDL